LPAELIDDEDDGFEEMDTNQDGVIDREEFEAALKMKSLTDEEE
jgi:Ca2+-binding EF-hand superfamily protein